MEWYENQNLYETEYRSRFCIYETDSAFCFIKKIAIFLWNGIQNPFHKYRNGFCIPFHKKICNFFYETKYRIRFINTKTDSVFRFIKKFNEQTAERLNEGNSRDYETDYRIRFTHCQTDSLIRFIHLVTYLMSLN